MARTQAVHDARRRLRALQASHLPHQGLRTTHWRTDAIRRMLAVDAGVAWR
jgi:hypothetical protein